MFLRCMLAAWLLVMGVTALNNGLARTPPMGWLTWERFRCNTDCVNDQKHCIGQWLIMETVDAMASQGYKDAGYEYVIIDDCWLAKTRDDQGRLQPDPDRFPMGIKKLADYIHGKGLKFGIYGDFGTHTCGGYPGNEYYLQLDAQTYANWTVDYYKMDGCWSNHDQFADAYPAMGKWLNRTGRPILYSCSWPAYQAQPDYKVIAETCNIWRNYWDISDSWDAVAGIADHYGQDPGQFAEIAGPGNFNDPDMLIIGNFGLSYDQQRVQMAMWSLLASPLIMSVDLRVIRAESKALLQNKGALAVNQDPLGIQARRLTTIGNIHIWTKPVTPKGSIAFGFVNYGDDMPTIVRIVMSDLGFTSPGGYNVTEVFDGTLIGTFKPTNTFNVSVNPTGVFFGKGVPLT